jgi:hypothetical protein
MHQRAVETAQDSQEGKTAMPNGLTKVETLDLLKNIDLIGLTLTLEQMTGEPTPAKVKDSLIMLLGEVRFQLEKSHGLNITSMETTGLGPKQPPKHHTTPSEAAEGILRGLSGDDDQSWRDYEDEYMDDDDFKK